MFIVNVEGAVFQDDKWLVILRSMKEDHAGGTLSLVGGKVDQEGNTRDILERSVQREIYEEVGVVVSDSIHYVNSTSFVSDNHDHVINLIFLCEYKTGEPSPKSPDEVDEVFWMTYDEIFMHPKTPPWLKENIAQCEKARKNLLSV